LLSARHSNVDTTEKKRKKKRKAKTTTMEQQQQQIYFIQSINERKTGEIKKKISIYKQTQKLETNQLNFRVQQVCCNNNNNA
jgi:hypothetical protein